MSTPTRYPLQWPAGWKRTSIIGRQVGNFAKRKSALPNSSWRPLEDVSVAEACQRLLKELARFGVPEGEVVISTNVPTRLDGLPYSNAKEPADPGAAVYWRDGGQHRCMAIDRYTRVAQNIAALAATIDAMRAIERHGGAAILDRAFTGFTALPAPIVAGMKRDWQIVLGLQDLLLPTEADIREAYRRLVSVHHEAKGGDAAKMAELNVARDEALEWVKGRKS